MFHHGTIRKYTAALLDLFNNLEIQYKNSNGDLVTKNVPIAYSSREKLTILGNYTVDQLKAGNTNVLPRAAIALTTMVKADNRVQNKNAKIAVHKGSEAMEFMYNSVPYEFTFDLVIICRGMNEASMIVEQIAPKFNPIVNIDVWDAENLDEPTRIPVKLLDIGIEQEEYEEISSNLVTINIGLGIMGNLYPPIKTANRVDEFKMYLNNTYDEYTSKRADMMKFYVDEEGDLFGEELFTAVLSPSDLIDPEEELRPTDGSIPDEPNPVI